MDSKITIVDLFIVSVQSLNLMPYLMVLVCLYWDLDGIYWVLEDFGPDAMQRSLTTICIFVLVRFFLLLPGFLETIRALEYMGAGFLLSLLHIHRLISILTYHVHNSRLFFLYYNQLRIICSIMVNLIERGLLVAISIFYIGFIHTMWICIRGWKSLGGPVYFLFSLLALVVVMSITVTIPIFTIMGEAVRELPKHKRKEMRLKYLKRKDLKRLVCLKKGNALGSIRFSYGSYYLIGKRFSRNIIDNVIQHLLSFVLLFDMHGRRSYI